MIPAGEQFPFRERLTEHGSAGLMAIVSASLMFRGRSVSVDAILDTGATVNVLPYQFGLDLGLHWEIQQVEMVLGGGLSPTRAKVIEIPVKIGTLPVRRLQFAWAKSNRLPCLLGQDNFFLQFDVCFHRSEAMFEIRPKA